MLRDLVQGVGGERVDVLALIVGEMDPHRYELVKGDEEKFAGAQMVVANGLGLEHGASLQKRMSLHPTVVSLGDLIRQRAPEMILQSEDGVPDPHIWMDASLFALGVDPLVEQLSLLDPEGAAVYRENGSHLLGELAQLHEEVLARFAAIDPEKRFLITSHDAFHYFARSYLATEAERVEGNWHERCAAPEGLAPEAQIGSADIQWIVHFAENHSVAVLFPESNVSRGSLAKILSVLTSKGVRAHLARKPLYGDAMGPAGSGADSYLGMIRCNARTIAEEWSVE